MVDAMTMMRRGEITFCFTVHQEQSDADGDDKQDARNN